MELLILLLSEALLYPLIAALGTILSAAFSIILNIFELIWSVASTGKSTPKQTTQSQKSKTKIFQKLGIISGIIFITTILSLLCINLFFFTPAISFITTQVAHKTNSTITFESVSGNVFSGILHIEKLHASTAHRNPDKKAFNISGNNIDLDINVFSLMFGQITVENLTIKDVTGTLSMNRKNSSEKQNQQKSERTTKKAKRVFQIQNLSLKNINLTLEHPQKPPLKLELQHIKSAPFRSNYAVFDTFFRSNILGTLNGHTIKIISQEIENGRKTQWYFDNFPIEIVSYYVQKPPLSWIKKGIINIHVEDEWQYDQNAEIDMDWHIELKDFEVQAPETSNIAQKTLAAPIVNYMNSKQDQLDVEFSLVMNEQQFKSATSLDAASLWQTTTDAFSATIAKFTGQRVETIKDSTQTQINRFKDFLDKKRQK